MGGLAAQDDYDPFAAEKFLPQGLSDWTEQAAPKDLAIIKDRAQGVWNTPQRAFEAVQNYRDTGNYDAGPILDAAMVGTSGGLLGGVGDEAGMVLTAGRRRPLPPPQAFEANPRAVIGGNMPPPEMAMGDVAAAPPAPAPAPVTMGEVAAQTPKTWAQDLPRPQPAAQSTDIPNIRGLPVADAIDIARTQPHLIKAGDQSEGFYVGSPRDATSKQWLNKKRSEFDAYVASDPRGGDWYNRYRGGVSDVTGNDPLQNQWMSNQEGQWSAGVDPGSELHFALKENNASIAGMPVKAARPAQHEAHMAALAAQDPALYQLGDKTGEYARLVNPDQSMPPGATGVNDFRFARSWGYTEPDGSPQKGALTPAAHRFTDMETALAVDRANKSNLGGRSDWTGEQLQAAPWVRQKALDIQARGGKNDDDSFKISYDEAFARANNTITQFFPRQTAYATFEAQPGSVTGHLPGSVAADPAARASYAADPASTWATAPGGRDAIYAGLGVPGTGNFMRVRPSQPMTGYYKTPEGVVETNPGEAARPLVTFDTPNGEGDPFKTLTAHDKTIMDASEAFRGYLDAQNASAYHKNWTGGPLNQMNSLFFPRSGPAAPGDLFGLQNRADNYGLGDVVDTGQGITSTSFHPQLTAEQGKQLGKGLQQGQFDSFGEPARVRTEGGYINYTDKWPAGVGSGEATRHMLDYVTKTPELRAAFNNNPYIAERALARLDRDKAWADKWGAPREDIQNARRIIAEGPGGIDRLEAALKKGTIALPVVGALLAGGVAQLKQDGQF